MHKGKRWLNYNPQPTGALIHEICSNPVDLKDFCDYFWLFSSNAESRTSRVRFQCGRPWSHLRVLPCACQYHCRARVSITAVRVSVSLPCACQYHCRARVIITAVRVSLSLPCACQYHCRARVSITAVRVSVSLPCACHYHCRARVSITAVRVSVSLPCACQYVCRALHLVCLRRWRKHLEGECTVEWA